MDNIDDFQSAIAIVGMAGRFPGAKTIKDFWYNLQEGIESIQHFSEEDIEISSLEVANTKNPNYVKARGILTDVDLFDAKFFGINPREAEAMDPQHRVFLECVWEALEDAAYDPDTYEGLISIHASSYHNLYLLNNLYSNRSLFELLGNDVVMYSNTNDHLATHVSYKLNLTGPSLTIQTACSSSLVAVHLACQSLLGGESDIALAGGVCISIPEKVGYLYQEGGILSADGHCRAFSADANGTVFSNATGVIVLKRLADAYSDKDHIYAVIKGSAINNDGALKAGYMAPNYEGQAKVISQALAVANVPSGTIRYIEAHGTGTILGDAVEVAALKKAFASRDTTVPKCALGSVKTNIGHASAAAGIVGLIKTALILKNKSIPPSLGCQKVSGELALEGSSFYVNTKLKNWEDENIPRRAGVSSFGVGGTNAHVILEEAPLINRGDKSSQWKILTLSAKTETALTNAISRLSDHLSENINENLMDIAYTLSVGRKHFNYRYSIVAKDSSDAVKMLRDSKNNKHSKIFEKNFLIFMLSGHGTPNYSAIFELYYQNTYFKDQINYCIEILKRQNGLDLSYLFLSLDEKKGADEKQLQDSLISHIFLFIVEYSLTKLLIKIGLNPQAYIGHGVGEFIAACLAGVISIEDALYIVVRRAQLMQQQPLEASIDVMLSADKLKKILPKNLSLAGIYPSNKCIVSGPQESIIELCKKLTQIKIEHHLVQSPNFFHSLMAEDLINELSKEMEKISLHQPQCSYISSLTGTWITQEQATDPYYWMRQLQNPILFDSGIQELIAICNSQETEPIFVEIGTDGGLTQLIKHYTHNLYQVLPSVKATAHSSPLLSMLAEIWSIGVPVDWKAFYNEEKCSRISLPTYQFERQRYWIEPSVSANKNNAEVKDLEEWFYVPSWQQSIILNPVNFEINKVWLIFADDYEISDFIIQRLIKEQQKVIVIRKDNHFSKVDNNNYIINPTKKADFIFLFKELNLDKIFPEHIVYLWTVENKDFNAIDIPSQLNLSFYAILFLTQALGAIKSDNNFSINIVTNNAQQIFGKDLLFPLQAMVQSFCLTISQEYENINCRTIDISYKDVNPQKITIILENLMREFLLPITEKMIAYREKMRWVRVFNSQSLSKSKELVGTASLRQDGVYIITGGLGAIGLTLANCLANAVKAKLILIGRSEFPPREQWHDLLQSPATNKKLLDRIHRIFDLEAKGSEVLIFQADTANETRMKEIVSEAEKRFGKIHGVIHAAGIAGGGLIQGKEPEVVEKVLAPKIFGTLILAEIFKRKSLDFFVLCSSIASILDSIGQIDYCAANIFLDAFAKFYRDFTGCNTISINWDTWQEIGMAVDNLVPNDLSVLRLDSLKKGIKPIEGQEAFLHIIRYPELSQVIVSTQSLKKVIDEHSLRTVRNLTKNIGSSSIQTFQNSGSSVPYAAPRNEVENQIVLIWEELLGISPIGVHDDLFEIGGHSILASQMLARLREVFLVDLSLDTLFQMTTIAELAVAIEDLVLSEIEKQPEVA